MQIKKKAMTSDERLAQLDESFKGKEKFTGESMMIADLNKERKKRKDLEREKLKKIKNMIGDENEDEEKGKKMEKLKSKFLLIFLINF